MSELFFFGDAPHVGALLDRLLEMHATGQATDVDDALDVLLGLPLDPILRGHLIRSAKYGHALARSLGCDDELTRAIRWGAMLHDIGKIRVPAAVLSKCGALTPEETQEMRRHSLLGAEMVAPLRLGDPITRIVAAHHERWNGTGYPHGLVAEAIPFGARIVSVVDAFDAMTSDRAYRPALPRPEVVRRMGAGRGSQWQPEVVDALLGLLLRGELDSIIPRPAGRGAASSLQRVA